MLKKLLVFIFTTIGGSIGWAAGSSIMMSFMLSMVGTGLGMYVGFKMAERYTP
jgi:hypothetical protein